MYYNNRLEQSKIFKQNKMMDHEKVNLEYGDSQNKFIFIKRIFFWSRDISLEGVAAVLYFCYTVSKCETGCNINVPQFYADCLGLNIFESIPVLE